MCAVQAGLPHSRRHPGDAGRRSPHRRIGYARKMESLLERLPSGSRIAVIRLRSLGDCVLTTPALALLKAHRPDLQVRVVVEPRFAGVFEDNPDVDEISPRRGRAAWIMALNLHGGTRSMWMTLASGAKFGVGFAHHRFSCIYSQRDSARAGDSGRRTAGAHGGTSGVGDVLAGSAAHGDPARQADRGDAARLPALRGDASVRVDARKNLARGTLSRGRGPTAEPPDWSR